MRYFRFNIRKYIFKFVFNVFDSSKIDISCIDAFFFRFNQRYQRDLKYAFQFFNFEIEFSMLISKSFVANELLSILHDLLYEIKISQQENVNNEHKNSYFPDIVMIFNTSS